MKIDLFSGFRRIAIALAVLWMGGWIVSGFLQSTYVHPYVLVPGFNQDPILSELNKCQSSDATEFFHIDLDGDQLSGTVCFASSMASNGEMLVPYERAGAGSVYMDKKFSTNVQSYTQIYAFTIKFTPEQIKEFKSMRRSARLEQVGFHAMVGLIGVAVIFVLTFAIGWIARGFIGKKAD